MPTFLLDADAIINYLKGEKSMQKLLLNPSASLATNVIVLGELFEGMSQKTSQKHQQLLADLLNRIIIYPIEATTAKIFAEIRRDLRSQGKLVGDIDILIAASCLEHKASLVTFNQKHFARIANLTIFPH